MLFGSWFYFQVAWRCLPGSISLLYFKLKEQALLLITDFCTSIWYLTLLGCALSCKTARKDIYEQSPASWFSAGDEQRWTWESKGVHWSHSRLSKCLRPSEPNMRTPLSREVSPCPSCPPCKLTTKVTCRCGKTSKEIPCLEYAQAVKKDPSKLLSSFPHTSANSPCPHLYVLILFAIHYGSL